MRSNLTTGIQECRDKQFPRNLGTRKNGVQEKETKPKIGRGKGKRKPNGSGSESVQKWQIFSFFFLWTKKKQNTRNLRDVPEKEWGRI